MVNAYLFPGQGTQFPGMGKELYNSSAKAKKLFELANNLLDYCITKLMFEGTPEALQQTQIAQPAIFLHAVILAETIPHFQPSMVAGHSLGEISALVASKVLAFADGLRLVQARALAMQAACKLAPATMTAVLGLPDEEITRLCASINEEVVVPANYNYPGQLVIAGTLKGVALACEAMKKAGAKKIIPLKVAGAFHSPLMEPAKTRLAKAVAHTTFHQGICPIYQNVDALPTQDPVVIKKNLIRQLTAPVQWTQTIQHMIKDGATCFIECGPGKILQGFVRKINPNVAVATV